jgi:sugar phosphate permease
MGKSTSKTMKYRYAIYLVIMLAYFFVYFHRVSTSIMAPDLMKTFGLSSAALGLFGSMYFWAYALSQLPAGILADRLGPRVTMAMFVAMAGVGALLLGQAESFKAALAGRFLIGFGVGFVFVPAMRLLADWFRSNEFATFSSLLLAVGNMGVLAATGPLVALMALIGWRNSMSAVGAATLIIAVLCYLVLRNKPADIGGASPAELEGRPETRPAASFTIAQAIRMSASNWNVWTVIIMFFVWYGTIMAFQGLWVGPWLVNVYGLTKTEAGRYASLIPLGMIVGCPLAGVLADRVLKSKFMVILLGACMSIVLWGVLLFMAEGMGGALVCAILFLYGFCNGFFVVMYANLKENVEPAVQGTATGLLNTFVFLGGATFQQVTAALIGKVSPAQGVFPAGSFRPAFLFCLAALFLGTVLFMTQKRK